MVIRGRAVPQLTSKMASLHWHLKKQDHGQRIQPISAVVSKIAKEHGLDSALVSEAVAQN